MELMKANAQWKNRPADERFPSVVELYMKTKQYADEAKEQDVPVSVLRTEVVDEDVHLTGRSNVPARFTHWAFGQLCARIGAPASYLRELPATLAVQNVNHGLKELTEKAGDAILNLLFHKNGGYVARAITSEKYARIWNYEVAERLLGLEADGWKPATPDKLLFDQGDDALKVTALYASDHDMFAFLKHPDAIIREEGTSEPLFRGIIAENSEVGAGALKLTKFLYRYMCGNHIIWGASEVSDISLRHVGSIREKFEVWSAVAQSYLEESATDEEAKIRNAKRVVIADTKENVLDALFGKRSLRLARKTLDASYDAVIPDEDGPANTVWGFAQGITRHSQTLGYTDERNELDKAAGRLLEFAF